MSKAIDQAKADLIKLNTLGEAVMNTFEEALDAVRKLPSSRETSTSITRLEEAEMWAGRSLMQVMSPLIAEIQAAEPQ